MGHVLWAAACCLLPVRRSGRRGHTCAHACARVGPRMPQLTWPLSTPLPRRRPRCGWPGASAPRQPTCGAWRWRCTLQGRRRQVGVGRALRGPERHPAAHQSMSLETSGFLSRTACRASVARAASTFGATARRCASAAGRGSGGAGRHGRLSKALPQGLRARMALTPAARPFALRPLFVACMDQCRWRRIPGGSKPARQQARGAWAHLAWAWAAGPSSACGLWGLGPRLTAPPARAAHAGQAVAQAAPAAQAPPGWRCWRCWAAPPRPPRPPRAGGARRAARMGSSSVPSALAVHGGVRARDRHAACRARGAAWRGRARALAGAQNAAAPWRAPTQPCVCVRVSPLECRKTSCRSARRKEQEAILPHKTHTRACGRRRRQSQCGARCLLPWGPASLLLHPHHRASTTRAAAAGGAGGWRARAAPRPLAARPTQHQPQLLLRAPTSLVSQAPAHRPPALQPTRHNTRAVMSTRPCTRQRPLRRRGTPSGPAARTTADTWVLLPPASKRQGGCMPVRMLPRAQTGPAARVLPLRATARRRCTRARGPH